MLSRVYATIAWVIVAIGLLHMATTFRLATSSPSTRVWFFGSGLATALVGALNLLHRAYGSSALGLRVVCRSANLLLFLFAFVAGRLPGASRPAGFAFVRGGRRGCALVFADEHGEFHQMNFSISLADRASH